MLMDLLSAWGLAPVTLADRAVMEPYFKSLREPLSDYTFSQIFTWHNSLRIAWRILENHLCIFANGCGDLTLLVPPLGDTGSDRALARAVEIMDDYNHSHECPDHTRVEYVSPEVLSRFDYAGMQIIPQGHDYLYDVHRMIDLAGPDLASKRQAKNRFMRNYPHSVEPYEAGKHLAGCQELLSLWNDYRQQEQEPGSVAATKRAKESLATRLTLEHADELGLRGMVVRVQELDGQWRIRGFTFGEALGTDQSSIVVEKTDLSCKGLAQFIFSEFCKSCWADRRHVNAGDDWGLESLAWTKASYRPVKLLQKFVLRPAERVALAVPGPSAPVSAIQHSGQGEAGAQLAPRPEEIVLRRAAAADLDEVSRIERACFSKYVLSRRQLRYLQRRQSVVFVVAEAEGKVVGEGIALIRQTRGRVTGRIYSLAVDPAHRHGGIGRKLMDSLLSGLESSGAGRVYLEVEHSNQAAIALYERLGFVRVGILKDYYGAGADGIRMARKANEERAAA